MLHGFVADPVMPRLCRPGETPWLNCLLLLLDCSHDIDGEVTAAAAAAAFVLARSAGCFRTILYAL
jgi:hypothetical protein